MVYVYIFVFSLTGYFGVNVVLNLVKIYGALIAVTGMMHYCALSDHLTRGTLYASFSEVFYSKSSFGWNPAFSKFGQNPAVAKFSPDYWSWPNSQNVGKLETDNNAVFCTLSVSNHWTSILPNVFNPLTATSKAIQAPEGSFVRSFFAGRGRAYSGSQRWDHIAVQCACPRRGRELVGLCDVC